MKPAYKILLIDDDEVDRQAVLRQLRSFDSEIQCVEVSSGDESIFVLEKENFDAILLDFRLASETGLEVLKILNLHEFLQIPVIMLSGMDDENLILECLENGAQDYLLKNEFNAKNLMRSIRYAQERMHLLKQVKALANYDPLTNLANRSRFAEFLENAILRAERRNDVLAVIYIDLDNFKNINDTYGHGIGDYLLVSVGERLLRAVREADVVARLGGDEFAIIVENIKTASNIVPLAKKIISLLATSHHCHSHEISVSPSIGIAVYPECGSDKEIILRSADTAMYHAKKHGKNNYQFFHPKMHEHVKKRLAIENGLRLAITQNELEVYYQPQIDISSQQLIGMEALLRWDSRELGKIGPAVFIPIAEDTGIIDSIGTWVMTMACQQNNRWLSECQLDIPLKISVNVSLIQLKNIDFYGDLKQLIQTTGVSPHSLVVEITESVMMDDPEMLIPLIQKIHDLGIKIALDDFGTGYSSLSYLRRMPIDILKVDQSFVKHIGANQKDEAIVKTIIAMAKNLDLQVLAEGVETQIQLDFLKQNQCNFIQGYYFGQPMPTKEATQFIKDYS